MSTDKQEVPPDILTAGFHSRGYLPHLKAEGKSYFVTFRLAGTLLKEVLLRLKLERERILQNALAHKRPLTSEEQDELFLWYSTKVDSYLDAGRGECFLANPKIASVVVDALRCFEGERYELRSWVVMPNHVHVVVWPKPPVTLSAILHSWKSFTATKANRILERTGDNFWQRESYDHFVRDDEEMTRCCSYTIHNPVKAGLCERVEDWRWSSAYRLGAGSRPNQQAKMPALRAEPAPPTTEDAP